MSVPTCAECAHGLITEHSSKDKCAHANNVGGHHPFALRHDETLCGTKAVWFSAPSAKSAIYKAPMVKA